MPTKNAIDFKRRKQPAILGLERKVEISVIFAVALFWYHENAVSHTMSKTSLYGIINPLI
jgi:hypothetical protein